jgi:uncharacterized protein YutE (UPF0331/DUF86 family)
MVKNVLEVLKNNVQALKSSINWLERSYNKCLLIGIKIAYSEEEFDSFENLTSRYARSSDLLIHKVLRSLDAVEFLDSGSLIDVLNRAEQRGIIDSVLELRSIKDIRNEIAHAYKETELTELFAAVFKGTPRLFEITKRIIEYSDKYI